MDPIIASIATAVLAALGAALRSWVQTVLTPKRLATVVDLTRAVISGAEEVGNFANLPPKEKYEYAENALRVLSKRTGLRLKDEELNAFIHAVLYEDHQQQAVEREYLTTMAQSVTNQAEVTPLVGV